MPNWTVDQLIRYAYKTKGQLPSPGIKPNVRPGPVRKVPAAKESTPRFIVRVKSYRSKLLDPDNLCAKSLIDGLRYSGLIPGDGPDQVEVSLTQELCEKGQEGTEIEVIDPTLPGEQSERP